MPAYSGMWTLSQVAQAIKNNDWTGTPPTVVEYLIVAGGGGGGISSPGGGAGAGGLLQGFAGITVGSSYYVTVGAGGSTNTVGNNSVFDATGSGASTGRIVATAGGKGGSGNYSGENTNGGSGGGGGGQGGSGGVSQLPGTGISGQGNTGGGNYAQSSVGPTGGGGGAGTVGLTAASSVAGNGGAGIASDITGTRTVYAGGGGGGIIGGTAGVGGVGGGGNGSTSTSGGAGTSNTGGGGGGASTSGSGGTGGSGIVVIRYPGFVQYFTGGTVTCIGGYVVHTFLTSSTLAPTNPTYLGPLPGTPTIGTATATGTTAATVTFTAPTSDGGSPITSYTAVSSPGGITGTLSQAGSGTIGISSGLSSGTNYTFTVYATNAVGNGTASTASNQITTLAYYRGYFDWTTSQYLTVSNSNGVNLSDNNNWTLEFWSYTTISSLNGPMIDKDGISGSRNSSYNLSVQNGYLFYYIGQGQGTSGSFIQGTSATLMPLNQWVHIAMVRNGTSFVLYQNGTSIGSGTIGFSMIDGGAAFYVGHQAGAGNRWGGYMSNLRIVKGTSVYTSNFTPPTLPLTAISGTTLLTLKSATLVDSSGVGQAITQNTSIPVAIFGGFSSAP